MYYNDAWQQDMTAMSRCDVTCKNEIEVDKQFI